MSAQLEHYDTNTITQHAKTQIISPLQQWTHRTRPMSETKPNRKHTLSNSHKCRQHAQFNGMIKRMQNQNLAMNTKRNVSTWGELAKKFFQCLAAYINMQWKRQLLKGSQIIVISLVTSTVQRRKSRLIIHRANPAADRLHQNWEKKITSSPVLNSVHLPL